MVCCTHETVFYTEHSSIVCANCGIERRVLANIMDYKRSLTSAPLCRFYNRHDRWCTLVKKVCGIHNGPQVSDPVWEYLEGKKPFKSTQAILECLRKSKLKNKHYPSLHAFSKNFCSTYRTPREHPDAVYKKLCNYFTHILFLWANTTKKKPKLFFSYNWLLEQGIAFYNLSDYSYFIKRLKCANRRGKYVNLLLRLYEIHVGKKSHEQLDTHSPNESTHQLIHRNRLRMPPNPLKQTPGKRPGELEEDSKRGLGYRLLKSLDRLGKI